MENDKKSVDFFLGAVGPGGFRGYFEQLGAEPGIQLYLIKSGPGCGKSTMMRRIAQKRATLWSASIVPPIPTASTA